MPTNIENLLRNSVSQGNKAFESGRNFIVLFNSLADYIEMYSCLTERVGRLSVSELQ
jgi:hypothetical protein